jgi:phenylacetate-coenzyme A ligase PaaK-like adenylate-forming protein
MPDYEELRERHQERAFGFMLEHLGNLSWTPEQIAQEQTVRLRALLRTAIDGSPWHRERLRHVDVDDITVASIDELPVMTKDDLMAHWDDIVTDRRLTLALAEEHLAALGEADGYLLDDVHVVASGGSSGRRGVFAWGWEAWARASVGAVRWPMRYTLAHDPDAMSHGPPVLALLSASAPTHMSGAMRQTFGSPTTAQHLSARTPLPELVAGLNELQPDGLNGYAGVLYELAREAIAGRLRIQPRLVTSDGEPLLPEIRVVLEEAWGVPVGNVYGTSEGCVTGASCYDAPGMHLSMDMHVFEPVDRDRRSVAPGVLSDSILLTNLVNPVLPLIRYEITDRVRVIDEPCPCGCAFTRIDDIEGRLDHVFTYGDGTVVHPHVFRSPLSQVPSVVEYQVRQTVTGAEVDVRVDGPTDLDALGARIGEHLRDAGLASPSVSVRAIEEGQRTAADKQRRFVPLDDGAV